jgi:hypothetical protein
MTEEIKHINKKNQEYIAEGNRMTKEIKGEFYPCKPDIFEETYESVE